MLCVFANIFSSIWIRFSKMGVNVIERMELSNYIPVLLFLIVHGSLSEKLDLLLHSTSPPEEKTKESVSSL